MDSLLRILYLDADPLDVERAQAVLAAAGLDSTIVRVETRAAFAAALAEGPYDLILSENALPAYDGLQALELARATHPEVPFIFVSGALEEEEAIERLTQGATDYVFKQRLQRLVPVTRRALQEAAERRERLRAVEAQRNSEQYLRALVEHSADGIALFAPDGAILYASPSTTKVLGYTPAELVRTRAFALIHADDTAHVRDRLRACLQQPAVGIAVQARVRHKDGSWRWLEGVLTNLLAQPDVRAIVNNFRDITERKQAADAIWRHTLTFQTIHDAIYFTDVEGRVIDCNLAAERISGYALPEVLGKRLTFLYKPAEAALRTAEIERALQCEGRWAGEVNFVRKDGSEGVVETTVAVMLDPQGQPLGAVSTNRDVTERKLAEAALRASEQMFRAVFDSTLDAVFIIDNQGHFVGVNPAAARLTGLSQNALARLGYGDFQGRAAMNDLERLWQQFLLRGEGRGELSFVARDKQTRDVEYYGKTNFIPGYHLAVVYDITERKRAEAARLARDAAEQANQAKSAFLSRMSHELRTPLNSILGFTQLLLLADLTPQQAADLGHILKAGEHLLTLINEVLDLAQIESGQLGISLEPVDFPQVLQECLEMLRPMAEQRRVSMLPDTSLEHPWHVLADRQRLRQALLNILTNAVKYNHAGGAVVVSAAQLGPRLRIRVRDTGLGIPADKLAHLFTPFQRLGAEKTGVEGTGLGLALSKYLVEAMQGTIGVESEAGQGSTFWVDLATAENPHSQARQGQAGVRFPATLPAQTRTLLYVEDNLASLHLIERVLQKVPAARLLSTVQGALGLEMARRNKPDLILLDLHLPDMNGDEVLRRLQTDPQTRSIPVVILSADATPSQIEYLRAAGAYSYLTKPLSLQAFLGVLDDVFRERN